MRTCRQRSITLLRPPARPATATSITFLLPQGADVCTDTTYSLCYSTDSGAQWFFCGYHTSVDFADIGHVVYAVEPYQDVSTPTVFTLKASTCAVQPNTPNGTQTDSTDDMLSRATFGMITDPDGNGWVNVIDLDFFGTEINDECQFADTVLQNAATGNYQDVYFYVDIFRVGLRSYGLLPIYDNSQPRLYHWPLSGRLTGARCRSRALATRPYSISDVYFTSEAFASRGRRDRKRRGGRVLPASALGKATCRFSETRRTPTGRSGAFGVFDCRDPLCVGSSRTDAQPLGSLPGRRFANPISAGMCLGLTSRPESAPPVTVHTVVPVWLRHAGFTAT